MALSEHPNMRGGASLLSGWKQIALHFNKDVRTVRRWADDRGLPVHRTPGERRGTVFAFQDELDAWLRHQDLTETAPPQATAGHTDRPAWRGPTRRQGLALGAGLGVLMALGAVTWPWRRPHQPHPRALSLYLDGMFLVETRVPANLTRAVALFEEAAALDPLYAAPHAGLADALNLVSQYGSIPAQEAYPRAKAAAERALAIDPDNAQATAALAFNSLHWARDYQGAWRLFDRAVRLDPEAAHPHHWYAMALMLDRRFDRALEEIELARRLKPDSAAILANKALILFHAGRVDEAEAILTEVAALQPLLRSPPEYLATLTLATGREAEFLRHWRRGTEIGGDPDRLAIVAAAEAGFAAGGREGMLLALRDAQRAALARGGETLFAVALTESWLGNREAALDMLEASFTRGEREISGLRLEPALLPLHDDPRFRGLVERAGLTNG